MFLTWQNAYLKFIKAQSSIPQHYTSKFADPYQYPSTQEMEEKKITTGSSLNYTANCTFAWAL